MKGRINYAYYLTFISDSLREIFDRNREIILPYPKIRGFIRRIRVWSDNFPKPPPELVRRWDMKGLKEFYASKIDFSLFSRFPDRDRELIIDEITSYIAREIMDGYVGVKLRNLAELGIATDLWRRYREMVREYYDRVVPEAKKDRIERFRQKLLREERRDVERIMDKARGELFCEVDMLRRMSPMALEEHLRWISIRPRKGHLRSGGDWEILETMPEEVRRGFEILGISPTTDIGFLRTRYRELAKMYHPDKGGEEGQMLRINEAYQTIMNFLLGRR